MVLGRGGGKLRLGLGRRLSGRGAVFFLAIGLLIFPQSTRRPSCLVSSSIFLTIPDAIPPHFCDSFLPATSSFRPLSFVLTNTYHQPEWVSPFWFVIYSF